MDAFAVSICKGLSVGKCTLKHMLICGLYFGAFQAIMPFIGYLLGAQFDTLVSSLAPYIAFILLALIGINMIRESRSKDEEDEVNADFSWRAMLPLAVATSIDALAVGVSFAFLQVNILPAVCLIGLTTFVCSIIGVKIGSIFGDRYKGTRRVFRRTRSDRHGSENSDRTLLGIKNTAAVQSPRRCFYMIPYLNSHSKHRSVFIRFRKNAFHLPA